MIGVLFLETNKQKTNKKQTKRVDKMFFDVYNIIVNQTKQHF